jgi:hypothetical protein
MRFTFTQEGGNFVVAQEVTGPVSGSERMLAIGGGVKAKLVKTKEGRYAIASFYFDRDRFDKARANDWLEKHMKTVEKAVAKVQESLPVGSFQDITLRLQNAVNFSSFFPKNEYGDSLAYVCYVFADYCVVDYAGQYFRMNYSDEAGQIQLADPTPVDMTFIARESAEHRRREEAFGRANAEVEEGVEKISVREATFNEEKREVVAVLIEAGTNYSKKRHYPKKTIQEAAPLFAQLKNYIDHPTAREDAEKPERSIKDWVSTIVESWYEEGKAMGRIHIHDDYLWMKMKDPVFRESIGLSINASGKRGFKEIDGQQMEVIEAIVNPRSVDWVTEPGARGRVEYLLESGKINEEKTMFKTLKELREGCGELVRTLETELRATITGELRESFKAEKDAAVKEATAPLVKEIEDMKIAEKAKIQIAKTAKLISESKLPDEAQVRLCESLKGRVFKDDAELETVVKESITKELEYVAKLSGKKVGIGGGKKDETVVTESVAALEDRMGVAPVKEKDKE